MSKLASVLAAAAGVAAFAYLTGPSPSTIGNHPATQNASSHPISNGATAWRAPPGEAPSAPVADRTSLASAIETELRRLGCYAGPGKGAWSEDARRAMSAVTEHAAVRLPVQQPDYILLTLARRLPGPVCATPCAGSSTCTASGQSTPRTTTALVTTSAELPRKTMPAVKQPGAEPWRTTVKETAASIRAKREAERLALAERQRRLTLEQESRSLETRRKLQLAEQQRTAELMLLEARRRQEAESNASQPRLPTGRMSLGAVQLPNESRDAPLASVATAPIPGIPAANALSTVAPTERATDRERVDEAAKRAARRQREATIQPVARPPAVRRKAWTRTIFQDLSRNGP